eukprot:TRINITY_DN6415_c0_g1_i3.p1 TRINITY_DN6415_c0_g1~~TRINITY_DN6415_c0_g1_i3.p1  ORF type:complete len:1033 (+),score=182.02 TRINITY_DN6415_c0_g1_i3:1-3099(+)
MGEGPSKLIENDSVSGSSKLIIASQKGQTEAVTKLLAKRGSKKVNKRDDLGETALHKAAAMGHDEVLLQLIQKGADINERNSVGFTPFHLAVLHGNKKCAHLLLDHQESKEKRIELVNEPFPCNPGVSIEYSNKDRAAMFRWRTKNFSKINENKKMKSEPFQVGGLNLRLVIYTHGAQQDDNLSVYVEVANTKSLPEGWSYLANFTFSIVDQLDDLKSIKRVVQGHRFYKGHKDLGFPQFMKRSVLLDHRNLGYLLNDQLILEFDVDVTDNTNYAPDDMSGTFTWKILNFSASPERLSSFPFEVGGCHWQMSVYPKGKTRGDCISLYLKVAESHSLAPGWFYLLNFRFSIINQLTGEKFSREESKIYRHKVEDWGFPQFMKHSSVQEGNEGYFLNDSVLIEVQIEVIDRHRPSGRRYGADSVAYDRIRKQLDDIQFTPLHWAAYRGSPSGCSDLIKEGCYPQAVDGFSRTSLHWAVMCGNLAVADVLLTSAGKNAITYDEEGYTPLHKASINGNLELVRLLVKHGANPNTATDPLYYANTYLHLSETVGDAKTDSSKGELIDDTGNDVDNDSPSAGDTESASAFTPGLTPLQLALRNNKLDVVNDLVLSLNACVNVSDHFGRYPLHYAAFDGLTEQLQILLDHNAYPAVADMDGYLPIHKAIWRGHHCTVKALLNHKSSTSVINAQSKKGYTPLHLSVLTNNLQISKLLIDFGSSCHVNIRDKTGESALHKAAKNGNLSLIELLVKEGKAEVNLQNKLGITPIDFAVKNEDVVCVIFLLENGAKILPSRDGNGVMAFFAKKLEEYRSDLTNNNMVDEDAIVIPQSTYTEDMRFLLNNKTYKDITFIIEGKPLYAMKGILSARSEFFRVMFSSTLKESTKETIELTDITSHAFEKVLEFIYTDTFDSKDMTFEEAVLVLSAANRYMLERLKRMCERFIIKNIRLSNVSYILEAADLYDAKYLRSAAIYFIANHYQKMIDIDNVTQIECFGEYVVKFFRKYLEGNVNNVNNINKHVQLRSSSPKHINKQQQDQV